MVYVMFLIHYAIVLVIHHFRYATSLVGSTIMNGYLISIGLDKNVAFWGTIFGFGVINYLVLTWVVNGDDDGKGDDGMGKNGLGGKANRIPRGGGESRAAIRVFAGDRRRKRMCTPTTAVDDYNAGNLDSTSACVPDTVRRQFVL